jgi:hypothetical protein
MGLRLSKRWTAYLSSQPETGMGYQVVDVILKDGRTLKSLVVLNAQDLRLPPGLETVRVNDIQGIRMSRSEGTAGRPYRR